MKHAAGIFLLALSIQVATAEDDAHLKLIKKAAADYERNLRIASQYPFREFEKAVENGEIDTVKRMLDDGIPVGLQIPCPQEEWEGLPPSDQVIHIAARYGNQKMVRLLLDRGAKPDAQNSESSTPLSMTADPGTFELLLSRGANASAKDQIGWQPIHSAASVNLELVKLLIHHGANPLAKSHNGTQPIHRAAEQGSEEMVAFFLGKGAKIDAVIRSEDGFIHDGWQPLHLAANRQEDAETALNVCRLLLAKGADPNALNDSGETALHRSHTPSVTLLLLEHGAKMDVMSTDVSKWLPIHHFALRGDAESIRHLLDRGVDPNALTGNPDPETPLDIAVFYNRRTDAIDLLLQRGAIPTQQTLAAAERANDREVIRLIRARLDSRPKRPPHRR